MDEKTRTLIKVRLERAREDLDTAEELLSLNRYRASVIKGLKIELTCTAISPPASAGALRAGRLAPLCPPGQRPYGPAAKEG
jgi:hypothetical protein